MNRFASRLAVLVVCLFVGAVGASLAGEETPELIPSSIGVTRSGTPIECLLSPEDLDYATSKTRILLIGGVEGDGRSVADVEDVLQWFQTAKEAATYRDRFVLSAVPCLNPDGLAKQVGPTNGSGGDPTKGYPPQGNAYHSKTDPEAAHVWRWIGMHAPDLVVEVRPGKGRGWKVVSNAPAQLARLADELHATSNALPDDALVVQLSRAAPADVGTVPALRLIRRPEDTLAAIRQLMDATESVDVHGPSPARKEMQRRLDRTPRQIASELLEHYGKELNQVVYIPALAVIGRLRHEQATGNLDEALADVERIVAPYFEDDKPTKPTNGSALSGHLVFCEFAELVSGRKRVRYIELARRAADLAFDEKGKTKPVMPFHLEMSDSVFMGGPILARVGKLTGEDRYFNACVQHLRFMREVDVRDGGLYRHSPLDEAAWGRGNGFPAIGLAMCLSYFPEGHSDRAELLLEFRRHMAALAKHQDPTGAWHQVIDRPESYRELTSTCMITFAMTRGVRSGWLDEETYLPIIERAWYAIRTRIGSDGKLVDVCTGTGKQKSLRDYYDRTAILGRDPRGGAMALLAAHEIDLWQREDAVD
jgi:rhamnogalacturonyl hydrolase YesR